jgi:hypothetical protein
VAKLREADDEVMLGDAEAQKEIPDEEEYNAFKQARLGDNFLCPFQCDLCHFRNIKGYNPGQDLVKDKDLLVAIRRANLDAF